MRCRLDLLTVLTAMGRSLKAIDGLYNTEAGRWARRGCTFGASSFEHSLDILWRGALTIKTIRLPERWRFPVGGHESINY